MMHSKFLAGPYSGSSGRVEFYQEVAHAVNPKERTNTTQVPKLQVIANASSFNGLVETLQESRKDWGNMGKPCFPVKIFPAQPLSYEFCLPGMRIWLIAHDDQPF